MAHHACALVSLFAETPVRGAYWSMLSSALCFMMMDDMWTLKRRRRWVDESASGGNEDELDKQKTVGRNRSRRLYPFSLVPRCFVGKRKLWLLVGGDWRCNNFGISFIIITATRSAP
jgi:hypothetical protein